VKDALIVNLSDLATKRQLMAEIGRLSGPHEVLIRKIRPRRSLNANAYYWSAIAGVFTDYLREQYGDPHITKEQAHELLKRTVLGMKEKYIREGVKIEIIPDSRNMSTEEFNDYIEGCIKFLAEFAEIIVVPSDLFYEGATSSKPA
jgi:hypothetical protein